eukprot:GEMP01001505.1.p1 GENE.GEMP01001505.1~~GEMP01001505.1.p1  ORF type:complete len:1147 (+),score=212.26 GEMP01001505.1:931-4371(+)
MAYDYTRFPPHTADSARYPRILFSRASANVRQALCSDSPNSTSRCKSSAEVCACRSCRDKSRSASGSRRRRAREEPLLFPRTADIAKDSTYNSTYISTDKKRGDEEESDCPGDEATRHHLFWPWDIGGMKEHMMAVVGSHDDKEARKRVIWADEESSKDEEFPQYPLSEQGAGNTDEYSEEYCQQETRPPNSVIWSPYRRPPNFRQCPRCGARTLHVFWGKRHDRECRPKCSSCGYSNSVPRSPCARSPSNRNVALTAPSMDYGIAPTRCYSPCQATVAYPGRDVKIATPGPTAVPSYPFCARTPNNRDVALTGPSMDYGIAPTRCYSPCQGAVAYPARDVRIVTPAPTAVPAHPSCAQTPSCGVAYHPQVQQQCVLSPSQGSCEVPGFPPHLAQRGPPPCDTARFGGAFTPAVRCRIETEDDPYGMPFRFALRDFHAGLPNTGHLVSGSACAVGTQTMSDNAAAGLPSATDANYLMTPQESSIFMAGQQSAIKAATSLAAPWVSSARAGSPPYVCTNYIMRDPQRNAARGMPRTQPSAALWGQVPCSRNDIPEPFLAQQGGNYAMAHQKYESLPANERAVYLTPRNLLAPDGSDDISLNRAGMSYALQREPLRQQRQLQHTHISSSYSPVHMTPQSVSSPELRRTMSMRSLTPRAPSPSHTESTHDILCPFLSQERKKIRAETLAKVATPSTATPQAPSPELLQPDSSITNSVSSKVPLRSTSPPRAYLDDPSLAGSFRDTGVATVPQLRTGDVTLLSNAKDIHGASGLQSTLSTQTFRPHSTSPTCKSRELSPNTQSEGTVWPELRLVPSKRWFDNALPAPSDGVRGATAPRTVVHDTPPSLVSSLPPPAAPTFVQSYHGSQGPPMFDDKSVRAPCQDMRNIDAEGFGGNQGVKGPSHTFLSVDRRLMRSECTIGSPRNDEAKSILDSVSEALRILRTASDGRGIFRDAFSSGEQDTKRFTTQVSNELLGGSTTKNLTFVTRSRDSDAIGQMSTLRRTNAISERDVAREADGQLACSHVEELEGRNGQAQQLEEGNELGTEVEGNRVGTDAKLEIGEQLEVSGEVGGKGQLQDPWQEKSKGQGQILHQDQPQPQKQMHRLDVMIRSTTVAVSLQEPHRPNITPPPVFRKAFSRPTRATVVPRIF